MNDDKNYFHFKREMWQHLEISEDQLLTAEELEEIRGLNDRISLEDISEIYLPLIKLVAMEYHEAIFIHEEKLRFLQKKETRAPFIIALAGSVAVGKSTTARVLKLMLDRWFSKTRKVELITTDGFLYPNKILEEKGIMDRKGFPESYDKERFAAFLKELKQNKPTIDVPMYSHFTYDVLEETRTIERPNIVIIEGINVLQADIQANIFPSDFFDFSVYMDAKEEDIKRWYLERFFMLRETAFQDESSYFHPYTKISTKEAEEFALEVWDTINGVNLKENIEKTKYRANVVLAKGADHLVSDIYLRK
ncbi:type I pantothenate kinase [Listeria grayi]|uniref:Pantothenate kinase n=2 Tax=Listeria grayi TaxID=1641 RepID=D7V0R8_LISGR|nr:type I pantothenate kinase [Listeria grayi]EFI83150.1 pantothenate kinase [Listeria grayi DSM 20601]STY43838.1 Pantothenate kinase [Listeria grayi]